MSRQEDLRAYLRRLPVSALRALHRGDSGPSSVVRYAAEELDRRFSDWSNSLEGTRAERLATVNTKASSWTTQGQYLLPVPVPRIVSRVVRLRILEEQSAHTLRPLPPLAYHAAPLPPLRRSAEITVGHSLRLTTEAAGVLWRCLRMSVN